MIDLFSQLTKFESGSNLETENACFQRQLPWLDANAYLNIIYKRTSKEVLDEVDRELRLPLCLYEFYKHYNGARLFLDNLRIYGCLPREYQIDRTSPLTIPTLDIRAVNEEFSGELIARDLVCIGSYGYDRSLVCVHRSSGSVACFYGSTFRQIRRTWMSLEQWLLQELERLSLVFTSDGRRLLEEEHLLPGLEPRDAARRPQ